MWPEPNKLQVMNPHLIPVIVLIAKSSETIPEFFLHNTHGRQIGSITEQSNNGNLGIRDLNSTVFGIIGNMC